MRRIGLLALILIAAPAIADEGMWPPFQVGAVGDRLRELGLAIDPARLGNLDASPLGAIASLGGCSASFVSPDGLVITNYHCVRGALQYNATEEHNLLETGFLAKSRDEELQAEPGTRVLIDLSYTDVTPKIVDDRVARLDGRARYLAIEEREKKLIARCEREPGRRCEVRAFYGGLSYYLIERLEIRDVRLVYAPARSIGEYGGDTDNWMWPRQTGDYAFYRAWVGPDGLPADYDPANVPYRPRRHLQVATRGLDEGDLVVTLGYPGHTSRYLLSTDVEATFGWAYPTSLHNIEARISLMDKLTAGDPELGIKYASARAGMANWGKKLRGLLDGFAKSDLVARKRAEEDRLQAWIDADPARRKRYAGAVSDYAHVIEREQATRERDHYYKALRRAPLFDAARDLYRLARERRKPDAERKPGYQERDMRRLRHGLERIQRSFAPEVDRPLWRQAILRYAAIPADQHVEAFDRWFGISPDGHVDKAALDKKLAAMYAGTHLGDLDVRLGLLDASPKEIERSDDPFLALAVALYPSDLELEAEHEAIEGQLERARRRFMAAFLAWRTSLGLPTYPDANGTLRVTFGPVSGYSPRDGVRYLPFTTLAGVVEKATGVKPYDPPQALLDAIDAGAGGRWASPALGSVPVDFLSATDTTNGNSGSATVNARGELVGLLFDGNYESMLADWAFMPAITRSIHVDIRYVLWLMEHVDGADRLLEEMGIEPAEP